MLSLNLSPIFKARGINKPFSFLVKAGFSNHTAHNLLNNGLRYIQFRHIELLCHTLTCEPNDLFLWQPDNNTTYPQNHPLFNLTHDDSAGKILETLSSMSMKQLKELSKTIISKNEKD